MSGASLLILSYVFLAISAAAFIRRTVKIWRMPVHLRWELSPVPKERGRAQYGGSYLEEYEWWRAGRDESQAAELSYMAREILFLKALREHHRRLWWFSYPFHLGLYLLVVGGGLAVFAGVIGALGIPGPGWGVVDTVFPTLAAAGYGLGALGALGLFAVRVLDPTLRRTTTRVAVFNLLLLSSVFATGFGVLAAGDYARQMVGFCEAVFSAQAAATVPGPLAAHVLAVGAFLVCLPFGPMMHFVAKYFTYHRVRWDDHPLTVGGELERKVLEELSQPVTWAAPHIGADGKRNWVDLATQSGGAAEETAE